MFNFTFERKKRLIEAGLKTDVATEAPKEEPKDISEPVLSILEAMKDISRWERTPRTEEDEDYVYLKLKDVVANVNYILCYSGFSYILREFSWMTDDEKAAVIDRLFEIDESLTTAWKAAQRDKISEIYCKER